MWKTLLISLAKELVFDALISVLKEEAKKSTTPIDDAALEYLAGRKPDIMAAVSKVF